MVTSLRTALKSLTRNKLQAALTLLGMGVGVAMVVIVSGLGLGAQRRIEAQIESAGPTRITIVAGNYTPAAIDGTGEQDSGGGEPSEGSVGNGRDGDIDVAGNAAVTDARQRIRAVKRTRFLSPANPLGDRELAAIVATPHVKAAVGSLAGNIGVDPGPLPASTVRLSGFDAAWPELTAWSLVEGRLPSAAEHRNGADAMVVSRAVGKRLWPDAPSPIGESISIKGRQLKVVGVIAAGDTEGSGGVIVPTIYVPNKLAQALLGRDSYDRIVARTTSIGVTSATAQAIKARLRAQHRLAADFADDFRVETQSNAALPGMGSDPRLARAVHSNSQGFEQISWEEMAKSLRQAGRTFTYLLAGAAAVSLLVGGIGVMNIMLVSVAARTREIGLRMALGARATDVMIQFLVEAVTLAALGGLIGLTLGGIGLFVTDRGLHWATAVSVPMLILAVAMAVVTGVAFGFGPARSAARLDPVIALRSE